MFTAPLRLLMGLLLALLAAAPAMADEAADHKALDLLFAQLQKAPDAEAAHEIDQRIWVLWTSPSDPDLAARMADVLEARGMFDLKRALDLLTALVADYPTYAEGWNQRATIYYMLGNYEASLADIDKVLEFEPRHFGALSGRAMIHLAQDKRALAIKDIQEALRYHPFLSEKQLFPELEEMTRI
jgi:tetratricopeptide (TPR) repeat protein